MRRFGVLSAVLIAAAAGGPLLDRSQSGAIAQDDKKAAEKPRLTQTDLDVLRKADDILADESKWNRKCARRYAKEDKTWSLYTALYKASLDVTGKFDHRLPALEEVRKTVEGLTVDKKYQHRLMDYNNDPETKFTDIKNVLKTTIKRVADQVEKKAPKK
jgi:hypothetical protein